MTLEWIGVAPERRRALPERRGSRSGRGGCGSRRRRRPHHLGNGTDLSEFDAAAVDRPGSPRSGASSGSPPGALVVGMVGRLVREKGYREFFHAARAIRARRRDVVFLAIGPVRPREGRRHLRRGARARVRATSCSPAIRDDVRDLLALMDVFVLPSWREGMPRSAIEAAAMGRAMVLTDIRGCREVARDGVEALLVPPRDARRLTAADRAPPRRAGAPRAARRRRPGRARSRRFDERAVAPRVVDVYRPLLPARRPPDGGSTLEGLRDVVIRPATRGGRSRDGRAARDGHDEGVPAVARRAVPAAALPGAGRRPDDADVRRRSRRRGDRLHVRRRSRCARSGGGSCCDGASRPRSARRPGSCDPACCGARIELLRYPEQTEGLPDAEHTLIGVRPKTAPGLGTALTDRGARRARGSRRRRDQVLRRGRQPHDAAGRPSGRVRAARRDHPARRRAELRLCLPMPFLIALALGLVLTPLLARLGPVVGLVDHPSDDEPQDPRASRSR